MVNLKMERTSKQLTEKDILNFESEYGSIPADYRNFLLKYNSGHPEASNFEMETPDGSDSGCIKRFLGINVDEKTLNLSYVIDTFKDRTLKNFFVFARDPGGNLIGIITEGADEGKIYYWDHEYEADEGKAPTRNNMYFVSNSFDKFIENLTE